MYIDACFRRELMPQGISCFLWWLLDKPPGQRHPGQVIHWHCRETPSPVEAASQKSLHLIRLKASTPPPLARAHLANDFAVSPFLLVSSSPRLIYASYVINQSHKPRTSVPGLSRAAVCNSVTVVELFAWDDRFSFTPFSPLYRISCVISLSCPVSSFLSVRFSRNFCYFDVKQS